MSKLKKYIVPGLILIAALIVAPFIKSNYLITVLANCLMFGALGAAWNLISGYGGQVSWCHSAYVALGAYTSILMYNRLGVSPFISMFIAMLLAWVLSTIIGKVSFRYRGPFFSITTIALGEIIRVLLLYFVNFTGGARGISVRYTKPNFWYLLFPNNKPFYYIGVVLVVVLIIAGKLFSESRTGYYLRAIKDDEDAAISLGIKTGNVKLNASQLSAMLTAMIGVFYGFFLTFVEPNTICSVDLSIKIGSTAIVGGLASTWGPVLGAFVIVPLAELASVILGSSGGTQLLYGIALVIIVIFKPKGLAYFFSRESKIGKWFYTLSKPEKNGGEI